MGLTVLIIEYLNWHYGKALTELLDLEKNFLWFFYHQFSIKLLLKTLFTPFFRIQEEYKGFDLENLFSSLVANTVARVVGFIFRSIIIFMGILAEGAIILAAIPVFIAWIALPAIIIILVFLALGNLAFVLL